jgi:cyclophilin family peptidyl-prolyl cis-trans isomerase/HEAT repeat protein
MGGSPPFRPISAPRWKQCCSLLVLAAAGACASTPVRSSVSPVEVAWRARLLRVEDTRRDEPAFVDSLLAGSDPVARAAAALTVGRIGARAHLSALRRLALSDFNASVSTSALFALGLLKDTSAASAGIGALRGPDVVALEGAWLLGELGERGRPGIVAALVDSTSSSAVRGALLLAAARLRPVPTGAIAPWVASADSAVAWRAAYALARGRSAAGVRALLGASRSPVSAVREQVARGLGRAVAGDSLGGQARGALLDLVRDTCARVRLNAVRSLASYGADARLPVVAALRDPDAGVRLTAAQSLDQLADSSTAFWSDALASDTSVVMQRAVADAAERRGVLLSGRLGWRASADWQRRAAIASLDGRGAAAGAVERVERWLHDPDGRVRADAAAALATLVDSGAVRVRARDALRGLLADSDFVVRASALGGLAPGATTADLAPALDAYELSRRDQDADARLAFWQLADSALARAGRVLPDDVARRLGTLAPPVDPLERIVAARIPRFAAWRDSAGTPRDMEWYEARVRESLRTPAPVVRIQTGRGTIELTLFAAEAPLTVYNFTSLARRGYFDGQRFHRVVPNFVVQGGDPRGDGNGGPGYAIRDELNRRRYLRGTLGMALSGPNTGGSQFFVTHSPQPHLDGGYTVFGQLLSGGDVLDRIVQGDRIVQIVVR